MKRSLFGLLAVLLSCLWASSVFASDWVFVMRYDFDDSEIPWHEHSRLYIDTTTIVRTGNNISFWVLAVLEANDERAEKGVAKITKYLEANLETPRKVRRLEEHSYDSQNKEIDNNLITTSWFLVVKDKDRDSFDFPYDLLIDMALKYPK